MSAFKRRALFALLALLAMSLAPRAGAATQAMIAYNKSDSVPLVRELQRTPALDWQSAMTASELSDGGTAGQIIWSRIVTAPWWTERRGEKVLVTLDHSATLKAQIWNGTWWGAAQTMTTNLSNMALFTRPFDVAYSSNLVVVVYANGSVGTDFNQLAYQTWDGSAWSGETVFGYDGNGTATTGIVRWVRLVSKPGINQWETAIAIADSLEDVNYARQTTQNPPAFTWQGGGRRSCKWPTSPGPRSTSLTNKYRATSWSFGTID